MVNGPLFQCAGILDNIYVHGRFVCTVCVHGPCTYGVCGHCVEVEAHFTEAGTPLCHVCYSLCVFFMDRNHRAFLVGVRVLRRAACDGEHVFICGRGIPGNP